MKILFVADLHIKLGQKHVPKDWQYNRFIHLSEKIHNYYFNNDCDLLILGGDIFDNSKPSVEELSLFFKMLQNFEGIKALIYTGNHEMINKKISCLDYLSDIISAIGDFQVITSSKQISNLDFDIIPYNELKTEWEVTNKPLLFTHVRGNIAPHVAFEIDPKKLQAYKLVIAGDLHSYQNTQDIGETKLVYPGSPLTTSFHRTRTTNSNGAIVVDTKTLEYTWIDFSDLPQLIRKTIKVGEPMVEDMYDRVIYEVEGNIEDLAAVKNSDLLDKKLTTNINSEATLILDNNSLEEEVEKYLHTILGLPNSSVKRLINVLGELNE